MSPRKNDWRLCGPLMGGEAAAVCPSLTGVWLRYKPEISLVVPLFHLVIFQWMDETERCVSV